MAFTRSVSYYLTTNQLAICSSENLAWISINKLCSYFQVIKEALKLGNPSFNDILFKKSIENVADEGMDCSFSPKSKQKCTIL